MPIILGGQNRGAKLLVPDGLGVRPTLARVREALFSMIASQIGSYEGISVLDPFAGSGALGLEAYSRGATHVDFFEINKSHYSLLLKNINHLKADKRCHAHFGESPKAWACLKNVTYDLVLCDPPYAAGLLPKTLNALNENKLLNNQAIVSLELDPNTAIDIPPQYSLIKSRQYAQCLIILLEYNAGD